MKRNQILDLLAFREEIAQVLCKVELSPSCFSIIEQKTCPAIRLISEVRNDGFDLASRIFT